jgi:cellulose synthase/poly-beta-1,6-N-acetylglucosamine synthase-like glycosyltransferase
VQASLEVAFWISFLILTYTFMGYQLIMRLLAWVVRPHEALPPPDWPPLTIVLAAYNEQASISARIDNLLALEYDPRKLSIIVVDDASTDGTVAAINAKDNGRVRVIRNSRKRGKAACLNHAMTDVESKFVVFTDARQSFAPDAVNRLVTRLCDPTVGAVSGALDLARTDCRVGESVGLYWRLERELRRDESRWDSCIGCTGAIYALRSALFRPIPDDTILDDVVIPMQAALQGYRVLYDMEAVAIDPEPIKSDRESRRKRRTLAGNFQMFLRYPAWLLPWRNRLWWQLISHKYLRVAAPLFLFIMLLANAGLTDPMYRLTLIGQLTFYGLGMLGLLYPSWKHPLLSIPTGFLFLNLASVMGVVDHLKGGYRDGWK